MAEKAQHSQKDISFLFLPIFSFYGKHQNIKYQNKDTFMTLQTSYGELRNFRWNRNLQS